MESRTWVCCIWKPKDPTHLFWLSNYLHGNNLLTVSQNLKRLLDERWNVQRSSSHLFKLPGLTFQSHCTVTEIVDAWMHLLTNSSRYGSWYVAAWIDTKTQIESGPLCHSLSVSLLLVSLSPLLLTELKKKSWSSFRGYQTDIPVICSLKQPTEARLIFQ